MKKKPKTQYELLHEYVDDYINFMERINRKRMEIASKEVEYAHQECIAFNLLRQNIASLEENGIPQN